MGECEGGEEGGEKEDSRTHDGLGLWMGKVHLLEMSATTLLYYIYTGELCGVEQDGTGWLIGLMEGARE